MMQVNLVKPLSGDELLARCLALSRRHQVGEIDVGEIHLFRIGPLLLDRRTGTASRDGRELQLSATALQNLRVLVESHPRPLTRNRLACPAPA